MSNAFYETMRNLKTIDMKPQELNQSTFKVFLFASMFFILTYANVSYAKTITVSEDFLTSIESISAGDIDQSLINFMGPNMCAIEYMVKTYDLDKDALKDLAQDLEGFPTLDENEAQLNLKNNTAKALERCAHTLGILPLNVLHIYVQVF